MTDFFFLFGTYIEDSPKNSVTKIRVKASIHVAPPSVPAHLVYDLSNALRLLNQSWYFDSRPPPEDV